jgi:hypothetical protein
VRLGQASSIEGRRVQVEREAEDRVTRDRAEDIADTQAHPALM